MVEQQVWIVSGTQSPKGLLSPGKLVTLPGGRGCSTAHGVGVALVRREPNVREPGGWRHLWVQLVAGVVSSGRTSSVHPFAGRKFTALV